MNTFSTAPETTKPASTRFFVKDPGSALTHFLGMLMTAGFAHPLFKRTAEYGGLQNTFSMAVFLLTMFFLYTASTSYHTFDISKNVNRRLKKMDHMMISIMIAGSYTPVCLIVLKESVGIPMFIAIWSFALAGIIIKAFWIYCPKWFSSILYIAMGWTCVFGFKPLFSILPIQGFMWLLVGGIMYTVGGVIYAIKPKLFHKMTKNFGNHEVFHLFVLAGSICHFIFMYNFVAYMK